MSELSNPNAWVDGNSITPPTAFDAVKKLFVIDSTLTLNRNQIFYISDPAPAMTFAWQITTASAVGTLVFEYNSATGEKSITLGTALGSGAFYIDDASTTDFWWRVTDDVGNSPPATGVVEIGAPVTAYNCECSDNHDGRTLLSLRTDMMRRLGYSAQAANPPPGMADLLNQFLQDAQRQLYRRYEALRTERIYAWDVFPGVRFYALDENVDACTKRLEPYKVTWVGIEDANGTWTPLIEGIPPEFYTSLPNEGRPSHYEIRQCIEIFPPPDEPYTLRIKGHFKLEAFALDADKTTIDGDIVFLHALANAQAHYGKPAARSTFAQLDSMLGALVAGSHGTARYIPGSDRSPPMTKPRMVSFDS